MANCHGARRRLPNSKSVVINGCHAGGIGASITATLAENAVHVIALSSNHTTLAEIKKYTNVTAIIFDPISPTEYNTSQDLVKTLLNGETLDN